MFKSERQSQIFELLNNKGFVTVKYLSEVLFTSESSVRRDLAVLEQKGYIRRSYGGAEVISSGTGILPFNTRSYDFVAEKQKIATKAAELIKKGDIVFLDQSSTAFFLARAIMDKKGITVVTNNIEILNILSHSDITLIASGGTVSKANNNCLIGHNAAKTFEGIFADFVFFSAKSLSDDGVITDCSEEEIFVRNAMFKNSAKKVFLCNSAKFGSHSSFVQCSLEDIDLLISEDGSAEKYKNHFNNIEIL